jgi:two-component system cell cycle sensor histidine kinase PleC
VGYWLLAFTLFALTAFLSGGLIIRAFVRARRAAVELRAGAQRLSQENAVLRGSLENLGEGLSVFNRQGRLLAFNSRFVELLELPADLLTNGSLYKILEFQTSRGDFGPNGSGIEVQQRLERMFQNLPTVQERITRAGRTLQIRRREMPDGIVSLYSDVTDAKLIEQQMVQARDHAEQANRAKGEFLANMSHELRTPLNAIVGFAEVVSCELFGPLGEEKYLEYVKDIHASGLHLLAVINEILDMAKIEAGKLDLLIQPFRISAVVAEAVNMLKEQANRRNIALLVSSPEDEIETIGDERAIKQAIINLLSNAIKFSHDNGKVEVRVSRDTAHGLMLEVEDHGIGMSDEALKRAMRPFEQAGSSTTRVYGGTGLGLPIANGLVGAHGGSLAIESCEGEGTRVRVLLPVRPENSSPARARVSSASRETV